MLRKRWIAMSFAALLGGSAPLLAQSPPTELAKPLQPAPSVQAPGQPIPQTPGFSLLPARMQEPAAATQEPAAAPESGSGVGSGLEGASRTSQIEPEAQGQTNRLGPPLPED